MHRATERYQHQIYDVGGAGSIDEIEAERGAPALAGALELHLRVHVRHKIAEQQAAFDQKGRALAGELLGAEDDEPWALHFQRMWNKGPCS